jgi:hypothetical protein
MTDGTYIPSPLVYNEHLITLNNSGVATFYNARTGERIFRGRIGEGGAFSASPIAADGRFTSRAKTARFMSLRRHRD